MQIMNREIKNQIYEQKLENKKLWDKLIDKPFSKKEVK